MIQQRKRFGILILAASLMFVLSACGAGDGSLSGYNATTSTDTWTNATLQWDPPTTNEDGTPLTDLAGYKVYFGPSSGDYPYTIDVGDETSVPLSTLVESLDDIPPTLCVVVTAYDTYGNESDYSNEVCKDITPAG